MILFTFLLAVSGAGAGPIRHVDIRSETLEVKAAEQLAIFGGGVTATRGDLIMECPEVLARYAVGGKITTVACKGPVTARQGARRMTAETGTFDNATAVLTLEGQPTYVEGEKRLTGTVLNWNVDAQEGVLTTAKAQLPAADGGESAKVAGRGPLGITSERLRYQATTRQATFGGNVVATRGNLVLRTERLIATHAEDGQLAEAHSAGPVAVEQGDRRASAGSARFTAGARTLVLEGDPVVTEGESSLAGERVTFLLAEDRVVVEKPRALFPLKAALP